jgi:hypothetical protein
MARRAARRAPIMAQAPNSRNVRLRTKPNAHALTRFTGAMSHVCGVRQSEPIVEDCDDSEGLSHQVALEQGSFDAGPQPLLTSDIRDYGTGGDGGIRSMR